MASPGGVALEDHLSDSDESFESASETFSYAVINYSTMAHAYLAYIIQKLVVLNMRMYMCSTILHFLSLAHSVYMYM